MTKLFLFDADHVLIDIPGPGATMTLKKYELEVPWDRDSWNAFYRPCQRGEADLKHEISSYLADVGWSQDIDVFLSEWFRYEHRLNTTLLAVINTLRAHGLPCMLVTDQEKYRKQYLLEHMDFQSQFDLFSFACDDGNLKDTTVRFRNVYEQIAGAYGNIPKESILFVDDMPLNVENARSVGFDAIVHTSTDDTIEHIQSRVPFDL